MPAGRVSVKSSPLSVSDPAELSIVKVKVLTNPARMESGAKLLAKPGAGGFGTTVRAANGSAVNRIVAIVTAEKCRTHPRRARL